MAMKSEHINHLLIHYIVWLIIPIMGELTVLSFQASSMHEELAKNPDRSKHNQKNCKQTTRTFRSIPGSQEGNDLNQDNITSFCGAFP
jgi:hypothetical protein